MVEIVQEKIRASITLGGTTYTTPDVQSFSVNKSRQSLSATFSASITIGASEVAGVGGEEVVIKAGILGSETTIFTGVVRNASINPFWDDPSKVVLQISGNDIMYILDDKKFSRRAVTEGLSTWAEITGIARRNTVSKWSWFRKTAARGKIAYAGRHFWDNNEGKVVFTPNIGDPLEPFLAKPNDDLRDVTLSATSSIRLIPSVINTIPYGYGDVVDTNGDPTTQHQIIIAEDDRSGLDFSDPIADSWTSSNPSVAVVRYVNDDTVDSITAGSICRVEIIGVGTSRILITTTDGRWGECIITAMVPHTHESVATGGPAFGTFA